MLAKPWLPRTSRPWFLRELRVGLRVAAAWSARQSALEPEGVSGCEGCLGRAVTIHGFELEDAAALSWWLTGRWPYIRGSGVNRDAVVWSCFPTWELAATWAYAGQPKVAWHEGGEAGRA